MSPADANSLATAAAAAGGYSQYELQNSVSAAHLVGALGGVPTGAMALPAASMAGVGGGGGLPMPVSYTISTGLSSGYDSSHHLINTPSPASSVATYYTTASAPVAGLGHYGLAAGTSANPYATAYATFVGAGQQPPQQPLPQQPGHLPSTSFSTLQHPRRVRVLPPGATGGGGSPILTLTGGGSKRASIDDLNRSAMTNV